MVSWNVMLSLMPAVAFVILSYNSAIFAYYARQDPYELMFVLSTYALVVVLFLAVHALEKTPRARVGERGRLVMAIWVVSVLLNFSLAQRVVKILPGSMSVPVWCSAVGVAVLGFWLCFFCHN